MKARSLGIACKPFADGPVEAIKKVRLFDIESGEDIAGVKCVSIKWDAADAVEATFTILLNRLDAIEE